MQLAAFILILMGAGCNGHSCEGDVTRNVCEIACMAGGVDIVKQAISSLASRKGVSRCIVQRCIMAAWTFNSLNGPWLPEQTRQSINRRRNSRMPRHSSNHGPDHGPVIPELYRLAFRNACTVVHFALSPRFPSLGVGVFSKTPTCQRFRPPWIISRRQQCCRPLSLIPEPLAQTPFCCGRWGVLDGAC